MTGGDRRNGRTVPEKASDEARHASDHASPYDDWTEADERAALDDEPPPLRWTLIQPEELPVNFGLATCAEAECGAGPGEVEFPAPAAELLAAARAERIHEVMGLDVAGTDHFRAVFAVRSHGAPALLVGEGSVFEFRPGDTCDNLEARLVAPAEWSTAVELALGPGLGKALSR